jgi:phosphohistidine swiveling domain-containing protein
MNDTTRTTVGVEGERTMDRGVYEMKPVYPFTTGETPELTQVGGKAMSLIWMTQQGLPVPPGFVLTVAFFEPWLAAIQSTPEWARVVDSSPEELGQNCRAVKALAMDLELDDVHREILVDAVASLQTSDRAPLFAVRSSSPEEDREMDSFAGAYETVLGVKREGIEGAVRRAFASCLDERVLAYKREHGFAIDKPRIALIVQEQVRAQTAGVAFSLNPLNNCYDEAVINANYGLGESVVSGAVSPDSFTVDKVSRTILERKIGSKETSIWLGNDGGTYREPAPLRTRLCLSDEQVLSLIDMLARVEGDYGKPIDVEWAFASGRLYLLQARPITAYVPLPEELLTAPGEPKHLYGDLTLTKWGMEQPVSVMGTDYLAIMNEEMLKFSMGRDIGPDVIRETRRTTQGRTYVVISNSLKMQGKKRIVGEFREIDALSAEIIEALDEAEYVPPKLPPALKGIVFKMIRQNLGLGWRVLRAIVDPVAFKQRLVLKEEQLREMLAQEASRGGEVTTCELARRMMTGLLSYVTVFMPTLFAAIIARSRMKKLFKDCEPAIRDRLVYLERALPHNVTIEMGLAMYHLAQLDEISACASGEEFASGLEARAFSPEFLEAWDTFVETYGFRAPMEMDPAAPRFYEQPALLFEQLRTMADNTHAEQNPQAIFERAQAERDAAYASLLKVAEGKGGRKAKRFAKDYATWVDLGGYRETPKYYVSRITDLFRRHVLEIARSLVDAGRLDDPAQVFDLHMEDLDRGLADLRVDLRALAAQNTQFLNRLKRVRTLPRVIDSRGKILRAPRKEAGAGELAGEPISTGTVRGKIVVLHRPDEKRVLPGEILVARATDPGWTPLFINASGVILEVGGMLQHGALVAREYGKPCVAGIENATSIFQDGQVVEVDGASGIVRLVA